MTQTRLTSDQQAAVLKVVNQAMKEFDVQQSVEFSRDLLRCTIRNALMDGRSVWTVHYGRSAAYDVAVEHFTLGNVEGVRIEFEGRTKYFRLCADE